MYKDFKNVKIIKKRGKNGLTMELGKLKQNPSHGGLQNFGRGVEDDQNLAFILFI